MQNSGEPELASLYRVITQRREKDFSGYDAASGFITPAPGSPDRIGIS